MGVTSKKERLLIGRYESCIQVKEEWSTYWDLKTVFRQSLRGLWSFEFPRLSQDVMTRTDSQISSLIWSCQDMRHWTLFARQCFRQILSLELGKHNIIPSHSHTPRPFREIRENAWASTNQRQVLDPLTNQRPGKCSMYLNRLHWEHEWWSHERLLVKNIPLAQNPILDFWWFYAALCQIGGLYTLEWWNVKF